MTIFEVGDRVKCRFEFCGLDINGKIGTIIIADNWNKSYTVLFDEKFSEKLHGRDKKCWNVTKSHLTHYYDLSEINDTEEKNKWWLED